jgi:hypothetical protein
LGLFTGPTSFQNTQKDELPTVERKGTEFRKKQERQHEKPGRTHFCRIEEN